MLPLIVWIIIIALGLGLLGGFSLFAIFSIQKVIGVLLLGTGIYLLTRKKKQNLISFILIGVLIGVGIFLALK